MSQPFEIESGVPVPTSGPKTSRISQALRALSQAKIGDSVFIPGKKPARIQPYITTAAGRGWCMSRAEGDGSRVWKIAEPKRSALKVAA